MPVLRLGKPEAGYILDMSGLEHFAIDCACNGKNGIYHGSHYKEKNEIIEEQTKNYSSRRMNPSEHTYLMSEYLLLMDLFSDHREARKESPLVIVCNDCGREFPFTHESYLDLTDEMKWAYNKALNKDN